MNDLLELHRLHLPTGRSYVVLARGQLFAREMFVVDLRLEPSTRSKPTRADPPMPWSTGVSSS
jgi:hypothetical protein